MSLVADLQVTPAKSLETEETTEAAPQPYGPDLSTHPVFQALLSEGYTMLFQVPEVASALVGLPPDVTVDEAVRTLPSRFPDIWAVDPDYVLEFFQERRVPTDTNFPDQWYFDQPEGNWDVDAPEGWWYETGDGSPLLPVVAVVDTGVARQSPLVSPHPDLSPIAGSRLTGYGGRAGSELFEVPITEFVRPNEGYPRPGPLGWQHGTAVASIIGAITNNTTPIGSMAGGTWAPQVRVFPVAMRQLADGRFTTYAVVQGLYIVGLFDGVFQRPGDVPK